ncbi:class I SAM-dependent methyltransferase [soil metagenome]
MVKDEQQQSWHYGLMATWWAEFNQDASEEATYFERVIRSVGEPALDLACGAGRVLLPLLVTGLDVDGCDISADMLDRCRHKMDEAGFDPNLYRQAMHELDLPRAYRTIYICDSFGIGGNRAHDAEALRCCYRHLAPGGALVFNHYLPYDDAELWNYWLPGRSDELPASWPEDDDSQRRTLSSGDQLDLATRLAGFDPLAQCLTLEMRARLWRDDQVIEEEYGTLKENLYLFQEIMMLLASAGFKDVTVTGAYSDEPLNAEQTKLMFVARK